MKLGGVTNVRSGAGRSAVVEGSGGSTTPANADGRAARLSFGAAKSAVSGRTSASTTGSGGGGAGEAGREALGEEPPSRAAAPLCTRCLSLDSGLLGAAAASRPVCGATGVGAARADAASEASDDGRARADEAAASADNDGFAPGCGDAERELAADERAEGGPSESFCSLLTGASIGSSGGRASASEATHGANQTASSCARALGHDAGAHKRLSDSLASLRLAALCCSSAQSASCRDDIAGPSKYATASSATK